MHESLDPREDVQGLARDSREEGERAILDVQDCLSSRSSSSSSIGIIGGVAVSLALEEKLFTHTRGKEEERDGKEAGKQERKAGTEARNQEEQKRYKSLPPVCMASHAGIPSPSFTSFLPSFPPSSLYLSRFLVPRLRAVIIMIIPHLSLSRDRNAVLPSLPGS